MEQDQYNFILGALARIDAKLDNLRENKITIPLSEEELESIGNGNTFDWTFDGIKVHIALESEIDEKDL